MKPAIIRAESTFTPPRRRWALRRQFAKHWGQIWFLRSHGMSGRRLRMIYGDAVLVWSVGGGIDEVIS